MNKIIYCLLLLLPCFANAQSNRFIISGKVIDLTTGLPLELASVFAQNTTLGTTTNKSGEFVLQLPDGGYDLAITFTGYKTVIKRISANDMSKKQLLVEMLRNTEQLAAIVISSGPSEKDPWPKYGALFLSNFIGETPNSENCIIKNKDALRFYFLKQRNCLKVTAKEPLEISNEALGYTITYAIDSFVYDYNNGETIFTGNPFFQEMTTTDAIQKNKWITNRQQAYNGSMLHFMRSLYQQHLKADGFEVKALKKENSDRKTIPIIDLYEAVNYNKDDSSQLVKILPKYHVLQLSYLKEKPEYEYMNKYAQGFTKFQISTLNFTPDKIIAIEPNGFFYPQYDVVKGNYLAWKRMADLLPYDFTP